jgi:hypothetical protein
VLRVESTRVYIANLLGFSVTYIHVRVANHGRAAATVSNWGIESQGGGNLFQAPRLSFSAELPAHVDSHADVSFYITADAIQRHAAEHRIPYRSLRAWVQPASGKREYAKGAVPLL